MISGETFWSMVNDFLNAKENSQRWRYDLFMKNLSSFCDDYKDFIDAIKYMHKEIQYVDTAVSDWILEAMCKTMLDRSC